MAGLVPSCARGCDLPWAFLLQTTLQRVQRGQKRPTAPPQEAPTKLSLQIAEMQGRKCKVTLVAEDLVCPFLGHREFRAAAPLLLGEGWVWTHHPLHGGGGHTHHVLGWLDHSTVPPHRGRQLHGQCLVAWGVNHIQSFCDNLFYPNSF